MALLAKQGWRFIDMAETICGTNPSYTWRSMLEARDIIRGGIKWRVEDDQIIKVWQDR
ncbi:hypothetical protein CFOL_v3_20543 [Cephalotus follicularis]|uniref:Uncharacterized protein n=1 Tax=Cephalotus follicularis TaxID=3775 RepID=A0A1Q3CAG4_CEPFO|nr:hypothetical protein CFOL_v3_20543 [Cephalotus follicularis]